MQRYFILILLIVLSIVGSGPSQARGQVKIQSANYVMDNLNFGSSNVLSSNQDNIPPAISSLGPQIKELTPSTVTIDWETDKKSTSFIQYGTSKEYGQETGNSTLVTLHDITVSGLKPETLYHYRVKSVDAYTTAGYSNDGTFTTPAEKGINSIKIGDVTYTTALISWTTGNATASEVQYGTTTDYGKSIKNTSLSFTTNHTVQLTDLTPGTDYHFRIVATSADGTSDRSSDLSFTTIAEPNFVSIKITPQSANEAVVQWRTNTRTSGIVTYQSLGLKEAKKDKQTSGDGDYKQEHTLTLKSLIGKTQYELTITATDQQGKQTTSSKRTFSTLSDSTPPKIIDLHISTTRSGDTIITTATWKTDEPSTSKAILKPKNGGSPVSLPGSGSLETEHTVIGTGLKPGTLYSLQAIASDPYGNQSQAEISFVTPKVAKGIFALLAEVFARSFGWLLNLFAKS